MGNTAIQVAPQGGAMQQQAQLGLAEQVQYANAVAKAGLLPQAYRGRPADIIVAMGLGQSMGLSPMESVYRINVIQGKPTASAELIAAQVRKAGHRLRLSKDDGRQSVTCTIIRADDPEAPFSVTRDRKWAEGMGLLQKDNYRKQPMTMLTWRAITACAREACPEALYGVAYTPDEMHDMDPAPAPQPVEAEAVEPVEAPAPQPTPNPQAAGADLGPIKERFEAFQAAVGGDRTAANHAICDFNGVRSMRALTDEQVAATAAYMDATVDAAGAFGGPVGETYEEDQEW